jgi:hypothetical protein
MFYPPDLAPRVSLPTFGTRARLGGLSVAGVEEEERKKRRRGSSRVLNLTWISSQSPSAADPRVLDLRAAWVEPDHRSSVCGRALDLASAPLVDLRRTSTEPPLVVRSVAEATRRWRVHPTVSTHTDEGLERRLGRALSGAARSLEVARLRCGAERERRKREMRLGFTRGRRARFCSSGNLAQPSDLDGRLTLTGSSFSPGGMSLSRLRPRL